MSFNQQLRGYPKDYQPDSNIIMFIESFLYSNTHNDDEREVLRKIFMNGYCYYFAHMLKEAFVTGEVCWCAPYSHFVYLHEGVPYDIEGVSITEADYFIPEKFLDNALFDFKHVPGVFSPGATREEIDNIISSYLESKAIQPKDL